MVHEDNQPQVQRTVWSFQILPKLLIQAPESQQGDAPPKVWGAPRDAPLWKLAPM